MKPSSSAIPYVLFCLMGGLISALLVVRSALSASAFSPRNLYADTASIDKLAGPRSVESRGGLDTYGYSFRDSLEPGGPSYAWEEISTTGSQVLCWMSYQDNYSCQIPINFNFPFYEHTYTGLYFNTDGYISFGQGFGVAPTVGMPYPTLPNNDIAIFGGSLINCYPYTTIYYQTLSDPLRFVLEAQGLCTGYYSYPITFEAILYPNGDIVAQYQSLLGRSSNFVGIENDLGSDGLAYGHPLADNLAIQYYHPFGVRLNPARATGYGRVGSTVSYEIELRNKTDLATAFGLTIEDGNSWNTTLPFAQTPLISPDESATLDIQVAIPSAVSIGMTDTVTILVTASASPALTGTVTLTTTARSDNLGYIPVYTDWQNMPDATVSYLAKVDPVTHSWVGTINLLETGCTQSYNYGHVAIPPDGETVWVSCYDSNQVIVLEKYTEEVLKVIDNVPSPSGIGFSLDGKYAFVGNVDSSQVTVINRLDDSLSSIAVSAPNDVIVTHPFLPLAYVTNRSGGLISVIDTNTLSALAPIETGQISYWATISHSGDYLYTSDVVVDEVSVVDTKTGLVIGKIDTEGSGGNLSDLETNLQDNKLYLINNGRLGIDIYSTETYTLEKRIRLPALNSWPARAMALNCDGSELYVVATGAYFDDSTAHLWIVNTETYSVTTYLSMLDTNGDGHHDPGASDIALCPQANARLLMNPPYQYRLGQPGETVVYTYTLEIQSPTPITDTISLETSGSSWPVTLSTHTTGVLHWGESFIFTLTVNVPAGAILGSKDNIFIIARSSGNPSNTGTAKVVTTYSIPAYLPVVTR